MRLILETQEQFKIFDFSHSIGGGLTVYFVPMAMFLLFARSLAFRTYNRDIFLMFLGFAFGILTLLIPPMPGWYFWIVPFFVYFVVKREEARPAFIMLNVLYFAYFLVTKSSDYLEVFQLVDPAFASVPNVYARLAAAGWPADTVVNLVFTLLQSALLLNIVWIYRKGIESNIQYKIAYQPYLIGLAGDSGSGKSTLSALLADKFGTENTLLVHGDDLHKWERGDENWKRYTHLDPRANRLHDEVGNVHRLRLGRRIFRRHYDHDTGRFTPESRLDPKQVIVFEGLHSLYLDNLRRAYDLKVFMKPSEDLRVHWKVVRDVRERGYSPDKVVSQLRQREDDSKRHIQGQEQHADIVVQYVNASPISRLGDEKADVGLRLRLDFRNGVDVSPLLEAMSSIGTVRWEHSFDDSRQSVVFDGDITAAEVEGIAYRFIPELWDTVNRRPKWSGGYGGIIQLFIGYYAFYGMRLDAYGQGNN
jgi:uridine kinase